MFLPRHWLKFRLLILLFNINCICLILVHRHYQNIRLILLLYNCILITVFFASFILFSVSLTILLINHKVGTTHDFGLLLKYRLFGAHAIFSIMRSILLTLLYINHIVQFRQIVDCISLFLTLWINEATIFERFWRLIFPIPFYCLFQGCSKLIKHRKL